MATQKAHNPVGFDSPSRSPFRVPNWNISLFDDSETSSADASPRLSTDSTFSERLAPKSVAIKAFPCREKDYKHSNKLLGSGLWSKVQLAQPTAAATAEALSPSPSADLRRDSNADAVQAGAHNYAIKMPTSNVARAVLTGEAAVLSHLHSLPGAENHIVPFHGMDYRNGAIVMDALPLTLETYIQQLNALPEPDRAAELAAIFPTLALEAARGLAFIHAAGVTHADVKPSNILLRPLASSSRRSPTGRPLYHPLFSDFSSAICPAATAAASYYSTTISSSTTTSSAAAKPYAPLGAGSWDFLSPALVDARRPAMPSEASDVHALAVTLLCVIAGRSPFEIPAASDGGGSGSGGGGGGGNAWLRREMVKQGMAMECVVGDLEAVRRLRNLEVALRWMRGNVQEWLHEGLWERAREREREAEAERRSRMGMGECGGDESRSEEWVRLLRGRM